MIQEFVDRFMKPAAQASLRASFATHPESYQDVVKAVATVLYGESEYDSMDPARIHEINDGDYQGTLVYVIGAGGYQPSTYWYVKVGYGSCSGCDTLQSIRSYEDSPATSGQIDQYMTLALHIVQGLKLMGDEDV